MTFKHESELTRSFWNESLRFIEQKTINKKQIKRLKNKMK